MLKDDQNSIQVKESTCQAEWYTMVSVCMWSEQNNHAKIRMIMLSRSINIISMSMYSTNMAIKQGRAIMQHAIRQSSDISACIHKISENTTIKMNSDTKIMLKDDQNSIQVKETTCQTEWYTVVRVCMWSDQNNHAKIRINTLSIAIRSIINNPTCQNLKWIWHLSMHQKNPQCAIKIWASTDHPIEYHVCFILSSSLTL